MTFFCKILVELLSNVSSSVSFYGLIITFSHLNCGYSSLSLCWKIYPSSRKLMQHTIPLSTWKHWSFFPVFANICNSSRLKCRWYKSGSRYFLELLSIWSEYEIRVHCLHQKQSCFPIIVLVANFREFPCGCLQVWLHTARAFSLFVAVECYKWGENCYGQQFRLTS